LKSEIEYNLEEKSLLKSVIDDLKAEKKSLLVEKNNQIEKLKENSEKFHINNARIEAENKLLNEKLKESNVLNLKLQKDLEDKNFRFDEDK
jgi:hypothetical protein